MKQYLQNLWAKLRAIPEHLRTLPVKTKQLTSLGLTLAMLVALPLFVFTVVNLNLNPQKKAEDITSTTGIGKDLKILALMATFQDVQPNPNDNFTTARIKDILFDGNRSVKSFVDRSSYGTVHVSGDVIDWYTFPISLAQETSCDWPKWMDSAEQIAIQNGIDVGQYNIVVYQFPFEPVEKGLCTDGVGFAGGEDTQGRRRIAAFQPDAILHETLHDLGLETRAIGHGAALLCGTSGVSIQLNYFRSCFPKDPFSALHLEYGDPFDSLGFGEGGAGFGESTFNAPHRIAAGWIPSDRIVTVESSGTYSINALDSSVGPVVLKIKKPDFDGSEEWTKNDSYYVEYNPVHLYAQTEKVSGVTIRVWSGDQFRETFFLDLTPGSCLPSPIDPNSCKLPSDRQDGFLQDGKTFTDNNNLKITQLSHTDTTATVEVDLSQIIAAPTLSSDKNEYAGGDTISVSWNNQGTTHANDWIGLVKNDGKWTDFTESRAKMWFYTGGAKNGSKTVVAPNFPVSPQLPGTYQLVYFVDNGYEEVMRSSPISVSYAEPTISTDKKEYQGGDTITATWKNPGTVEANDWVGLVTSEGTWGSTSDLGEGKTWAWIGSVSSGTKTLVAPKVSGSYQVVYFLIKKDSSGKYIEKARSSVFTISALNPCPSITKALSAYFPLKIYGSNIYLNWGGLNEKWFIDKNNTWYYIYKDETSEAYPVNRWVGSAKGLKANGKNPFNDIYIIRETSSCYDQIKPGFTF